MFDARKITACFAVGVASLVLPGTAFADCSGDLCTGKIDRLYINPSGSTLYVDPAGDTGALSCTDSTDRYVTMALDNDYKKAIYQLLLGMFLSGRAVSLKMNASGACVISYAYADS